MLWSKSLESSPRLSTLVGSFLDNRSLEKKRLVKIILYMDGYHLKYSIRKAEEENL